MRLEKRVLSWCVCAALMMGAGCNDRGTDSTDEGGHLEFSVRLHNLDETNIHIFALDETFPCCQVGSLSYRDVDLSGVSPGDRLQFAVGRNGQILKTVECTANDADAGKKIWWEPPPIGAPPGKLSCVGW